MAAKWHTFVSGRFHSQLIKGMMSNKETRNVALIIAICNIPVVGNSICKIMVIMVNTNNE